MIIASWESFSVHISGLDDVYCLKKLKQELNNHKTKKQMGSPNLVNQNTTSQAHEAAPETRLLTF